MAAQNLAMVSSQFEQKYFPTLASAGDVPSKHRTKNKKSIILVSSTMLEEPKKNKRTVAAVNRTRGSCMASTNFTTKPLRLEISSQSRDDNSAKPSRINF